MNNLSKVAHESAAAGIEPAISSRKPNALTTTPPSHTLQNEQQRTEIFAQAVDVRSPVGTLKVGSHQQHESFAMLLVNDSHRQTRRCQDQRSFLH